MFLGFPLPGPPRDEAAIARSDTLRSLTRQMPHLTNEEAKVEPEKNIILMEISSLIFGLVLSGGESVRFGCSSEAGKRRSELGEAPQAAAAKMNFLLIPRYCMILILCICSYVLNDKNNWKEKKKTIETCQLRPRTSTYFRDGSVTSISTPMRSSCMPQPLLHKHGIPN